MFGNVICCIEFTEWYAYSFNMRIRNGIKASHKFPWVTHIYNKLRYAFTPVSRFVCWLLGAEGRQLQLLGILFQPCRWWHANQARGWGHQCFVSCPSMGDDISSTWSETTSQVSNPKNLLQESLVFVNGKFNLNPRFTRKGQAEAVHSMHLHMVKIYPNILNL